MPEDPINPNEARNASRSERKYACEENLTKVLPVVLSPWQLQKILVFCTTVVSK